MSKKRSKKKSKKQQKVEPKLPAKQSSANLQKTSENHPEILSDMERLRNELNESATDQRKEVFSGSEYLNEAVFYKDGKMQQLDAGMSTMLYYSKPSSKLREPLRKTTTTSYLADLQHSAVDGDTDELDELLERKTDLVVDESDETAILAEEEVHEVSQTDPIEVAEEAESEQYSEDEEQAFSPVEEEEFTDQPTRPRSRRLRFSDVDPSTEEITEVNSPLVESLDDKIEEALQARSSQRRENRNVERSIPLEEMTLLSEVSQNEETKEMKLPQYKPVVRTNRGNVRRRQRRHQERAAKKIAGIIGVSVVLALLFSVFIGCFYINASLSPVKPGVTETIQVEIPAGSSTRDIAAILKKNKLIKDATIFTYYAKFKSYNNFKSGFYNLSPSMSVDKLAKSLQEAGSAVAVEPIAGQVRFIEGATIEQIATAMTDNVHTKKTTDTTPFTREEFLATVSNPDFIASMALKYPMLLASLPTADSGVRYQLEGYLYPATYSYTKSESVSDMIDKMLAAMDNQLQAYYPQLEAKNLTVNDLLTMASLVEKEASTDEDRRNVASVFYNRLNTGMALQSNIAILYAMGKLGQETTLAEDAAVDTAIDSPYNIYTKLGLMPGPVDSPSAGAIAATFSPNHTDYLYFVADVTTGTVYFSNNIDEHNQNVETYVNSRLTGQ